MVCQIVCKQGSNDSECERNEGFWSESHGELSDNVVAGGEVQAAGNEIRPYQFVDDEETKWSGQDCPKVAVHA